MLLVYNKDTNNICMMQVLFEFILSEYQLVMFPPDF